MIRKSSAQRGFTLIELAIVLTTMSVGFASAISIASSKAGIVQTKETSRELTDLDKSIVSYVKKHGTLPCPADATVDMSASNAGLSKPNPDDDPTNTSCRLANQVTEDGMAVGMLPFRTLNVPSSYAIDAYGNRLTYAVTETLTDQSTCNNAQGIITLMDETGAINVNNAAYVLLSHGKNGVGAWPFSWHDQRLPHREIFLMKPKTKIVISVIINSIAFLYAIKAHLSALTINLLIKPEHN